MPSLLSDISQVILYTDFSEHVISDTKFRTIVERLCAGLALLLLSPVILLCIVLIKISSPGSAIYRQQRVGQGGRLFTLYKLRTMYHDCEKNTGPVWSRPNDPRVTFIGKFLRWSHLDELPQLLNIVRGEMSFVGPRPERPEFIPNLAKSFPQYLERLRVLPGITGLAQIQLPPDVDLISVQKKLTCDLYYVTHRNFWLDIRIVMATLLRALGLPAEIVLFLFRLPAWHTLLPAARIIPDKSTTHAHNTVI